MVSQLLLGLILTLFPLAFAQDGINVTCLRDSVNITWKISAELELYSTRFFLGNCKRSKYVTLSSEVLELVFHYRFGECRFKQQMRGKYSIFENNLTFRPHYKGKPPAFEKPIQCITKGSDIWVPHFLNPGAGYSEARGGLVFHMALLNGEMTDISQNNVIPLGSSIPIWAGVDQQSHQPLLLLMEECFAAATPNVYTESKLHPLIKNKGCLEESKKGNAVFVPRRHSSSIILKIRSFRFELGPEVYIHCKLVAWDPDRIDKTKKACYYSEESERWELLDNPDKSSVCSCCASTCNGRLRRHIDIESEGVSSMYVLGPLTVVESGAFSAADTGN